MSSNRRIISSRTNGALFDAYYRSGPLSVLSMGSIDLPDPSLITVKQSVPNKGRSCHKIMLRIGQVFLGAHKPFPGVRDKDRVRLHTTVSLPERWWMEMTPSDATAC